MDVLRYFWGVERKEGGQGDGAVKATLRKRWRHEAEWGIGI